MSENGYEEVTVKEAAHEDAGRGIARVSIEVMKKIGLVAGDVIEIQAKKKAAAIVWPGFQQDTGYAIIRIDGNFRGNLSTGIDEKVKIRKSEAEYAKKVVIQPTTPIRLIGGEQYLSRVLRGRAVFEGQTQRIDVVGNSITLVITKVLPKGIAIVTDETEIELKEEPYELDNDKRGVLNIHYEDIGGLSSQIELVREYIELPLRHPEIFQRLNIQPLKGVLLYGPPGSGKTLIANAVSNENSAHFITISGPEIISKYYGESEKILREKFEEAVNNAPSIMFIDNIDQIASSRIEKQSDVERHLADQLIDLMDKLDGSKQIILIAAANTIKSLDPRLLRSGRFDILIELPYPDKEGRETIFQIYTRGVPLAKDVNLEEIANNSDGFTGADIKNLVQMAAIHHLREIISSISSQGDSNEELEKFMITQKDFDWSLEFLKLKLHQTNET
jgi:transitional endoplasmic reticulum ATPase